MSVCEVAGEVGVSYKLVNDVIRLRRSGIST